MLVMVLKTRKIAASIGNNRALSFLQCFQISNAFGAVADEILIASNFVLHSVSGKNCTFSSTHILIVAKNVCFATHEKLHIKTSKNFTCYNAYLLYLVSRKMSNQKLHVSKIRKKCHNQYIRIWRYYFCVFIKYTFRKKSIAGFTTTLNSKHVNFLVTFSQVNIQFW